MLTIGTGDVVTVDGDVFVGGRGFVRRSRGGSGTLNVNGTLKNNGNMSVGSFAWNTGGQGIVNLNRGGKVITNQINSNVTGYFNFNGGVLTLGKNQLELFGQYSTYNTATTVTLQSNGGTIDTNGYDVGIAYDAKAIGGTGTLTKTGAGTLTLNGANTYTGATHVKDGLLTVNGSIASAVTIHSGGNLSGTGTIGGLFVEASGVVSPGSSIGTLNVNGDVMFNSGSTYQVETNPAGNSDMIIATGTATIKGGNVSVLAGTGNYNANTNYTILTANGGLSGRFDNVTSDMVFLTPTLQYVGNNQVQLNLARNDISMVSTAQTSNQVEIADTVDSLGEGDKVYDSVVQLNSKQARQAFDELAEIHSSVQSAIIQDSQRIHQSIVQHQNLSKEQRLWGQILGQNGTFQGDGNARQLKRKSTGALFGYDLPSLNDLTLGVTGGFERINYRDGATKASADATQFHVGAYVKRDWEVKNGKLTLGFDSVYSHSNLDTNRRVVIGQNLDESLTGDYRVKTWQTNAELAYDLPIDDSLSVGPYAVMSFIRSQRDGFSEKGGNAALASVSNSINNGFFTLGLRAEKALDTQNIGSRLYADIAYRHAIDDTAVKSNNHFVSGGKMFSTRGISAGRNIGLIRTGVNYQISPHVSLNFNANAIFGSGMNDYGANLTYQFGF